VTGLDKIINTGVDNRVDYARFCSVGCKPDPNAGPEIRTCVALSSAEKASAVTSGGNGQPFIPPPAAQAEVAPPVTPEEEEAAAPGPAPAAPGPEETASSTTTTTTVAPTIQPATLELGWAKAQETIAAGAEARAAAAEADAAVSAGKANDAAKLAEQLTRKNADAALQLKGEVMQATMHAHAATMAAKNVQALLDSVKAAVREAAVEAGAEAAKEIQEQAMKEFEIELAVKRFLNPPLPVIAAAAAKAAAPYNEAMQKAAGIQGEYSAQAQELMAEAQKLQQTAVTLGQDAAAYQGAGDTQNAAAMKARAEGMIDKINSLKKRAEELQAVAVKIGESLPKYQQAAAAAAARAAALANPAAQPPPPLPALIQQNATSHSSLTQKHSQVSSAASRGKHAAVDHATRHH